MRLPAMPVRSGADATLNFDAVARALPVFVESLPVSARNGQEIYYLASAEKGIVWRLRYREASTSAYKWEFVGGGTLHSPFETGTIEVENAVYQTGKGPSLIVPLGGDYEYGLSAGLNTTKAECVAQATVKFGTAEAQDVEGIRAQAALANVANVVSTRTYWRNAIAAGATLEMVYRSINAGKAQFYHRNLWARPLRVG